MHGFRPIFLEGCFVGWKARFFFNENAELVKGQGLCFDTSYGAATDAKGERGYYVKRPSPSNNMAFAGVTDQAYSAKAGGREVDLWLPGSMCEIALGVGGDVTSQSTFLTCSASTADAGRFGYAGFYGIGTARVMQSQSAAAGKQVSESLDGSATTSGTTLTKTGAFTNAVAGDIVVILGGTGNTVVPGQYTIVSRTDNTATLSSAPGNGNVTFYVISGNPKVLAYLIPDGGQSGLVQWISPKSGAVVDSMVGGFTRIAAGYTIATDSTYTLPQGLFTGMRKGFRCYGTLTTNDYLVSLATSGLQLDGVTALNSIEFDAAGEASILEFMDDKWKLIHNVGTILT